MILYNISSCGLLLLNGSRIRVEIQISRFNPLILKIFYLLVGIAKEKDGRFYFRPSVKKSFKSISKVFRGHSFEYQPGFALPTLHFCIIWWCRSKWVFQCLLRGFELMSTKTNSPSAMYISLTHLYVLGSNPLICGPVNFTNASYLGTFA